MLRAGRRGEVLHRGTNAPSATVRGSPASVAACAYIDPVDVKDIGQKKHKRRFGAKLIS